MIEAYLNTRYEPHGRGPDSFDCWGLCRDVRARVFGAGWLPSFGHVVPADKRAVTRAAQEALESALRPCARQPGAIALAWRGRVCIHAGIVIERDGRQWILETDVATGPVLTPCRRFERRFTRVEYLH